MAQVELLQTINRKVRRHIRRALTLLPENYYVREQVIEENRVAPVVIEGPLKSWVFLGYSELEPCSEGLESFLVFNKLLREKGWLPIKYLAITNSAADLFSSAEIISDVVCVSLDEFKKRGSELVIENAVQLTCEQENIIRKKLIRESYIAPQCTTRSLPMARDSSAQLKDFFLSYDQELATRLDIIEDSSAIELETEELSVRLINGVAGSGKTLILINRALLYCKKYPERKVIILIHNKPVTENIKFRIKNYLGLPENLEIHTFHKFALDQKKKLESKYVKPIFSSKVLESAVSDVINSSPNYAGLTLSKDKICSELEYINEYLIEDEESYLSYERQGRGFALQRNQRQLIWVIYQQTMQKVSCVSAGYLPSLYIREACFSSDLEKLEKYHHILLDEAQFFAPSWLQLVRSSLAANGSIFMCADPNQGFLKNRLSWKSVGFNVRGRTRKLNRSYRTTYEILRAANQLLSSLQEEDDDDFVQPDFRDMLHGDKPEVIYSDSAADEKKRFINEITSCVEQEKIPLEQIIVLGNNINTWEFKKSIEASLGRNTVVNFSDSKDINNLGERIQLMSINSCTGVEAGIVFVLGLGGLINESKNLELEAEEQQQIQQENLRKLYVAMTRAGQKLVLFSTEQLPEEMNDLVSFS